MFDFLFGKDKRVGAKKSSGGPSQPPKASAGEQQLEEAIDLLEKKEAMLEKKANAELQKAKDFYAKKMNPRAVECMKRKKTFEEQIGRLNAQRMNLETQRFTLENQRLNLELLEAQKKAAEELKKGNKKMNAEKVEEQMETLVEEMDKANQVSEVLANPIDNTMMVMDDDELLNELELELNKDEDEGESAELAALLANASVPTAAPQNKIPPQKATKLSKEDADALAELEAELAAG